MNIQNYLSAVLIYILLFGITSISSLARNYELNNKLNYAFSPKQYTLHLSTLSNDGLYWAFIFDNAQHEYPGIKITSIEYYADEILIKKVTEQDARKQDNFKAYDFILANPDKRTKLQPVKHKWVINTNQGTFTEEQTLFIFEKYNGKDTFVEGTEDEDKKDLDSLTRPYARFRFRKEPSKQPPIVNAISGRLGELETWKLYGIDNGRITKVEFYIDAKLIQTYQGELPHRFECINPDKKPLGTKFVARFKVYDNENNVTDFTPGYCIVDKYTRTELHDEKWMYMRKSE